MIFIPIEERYSKNRGMFHSGAFAIAAAVVATGAAATSGIMGAQAADRAAKSQAGATRKYQKGQRKIADMVSEVDTDIEAPQYSGEDIRREAEKYTGYNIAQLERVLPGARAARKESLAALGQAQDIASAYMTGKLPKELADEITRNVAERYGAGFAPGVAGQGAFGQQAAFQGARGLGLGAEALVGRGIAITQQLANTQQNWAQVAGSFISNPIAVGSLQLGYGQAGMEAQRASAALKFQGIGLQSGATQNIYESSLAQAQTDLTARQAIASTVQSTGSALSGGLQAYSGAMGQQQIAQGMGGLRGDLQYATGTVPRATAV